MEEKRLVEQKQLVEGVEKQQVEQKEKSLVGEKEMESPKKDDLKEVEKPKASEKLPEKELEGVSALGESSGLFRKCSAVLVLLLSSIFECILRV